MVFIWLQNTCVWLQWLGFEGKHAVLCIRGFNYQALIRNMPVFQQSPAWSTNLCIFTSNMSYIGEISPFSLQKVVFGATWLRVFGEILLISPQKSPQKSYILLLCSIKSLHKIKILCLLRVCCSKLCLLWHFHSKMSNPMLHVMSSIYVQL